MKYFILLFSIFLCLSVSADQSKFGTVTQSTITATTTSALALSANPYREYLLIQNLGTVTVIIKFGSAQSGTEGIQIPAGGNYEPIKAPGDAIYIRSLSSTASVLVVDGV